MPALDPIDDTNLYPDKDDGGTAQTTATVNADDLNSIKSRISENRTQANAALAAYAGAVVDQTVSFSLASTDHGKVVRVDSAGGAVVITIPHTLFGSVVASGVFRTTILVTNADEAITFAGSGGIVPQYFGRKTIRVGDLIDITVTSASLALLEVKDWSDPLAPYVQGTQTSATRTLALSDSAQIIPVSAASNAVEVTIPHTLYDAVLGRAFQTTLVALNVTNAITFAGSGGLGLTYYGDSTIAAGDIIRISVESATVCRVDITHTGALSGPSSGTDGALLIWDGAGGRLVADSGLLALDVITGISDADTKAANALYPLVQTAHTSATKTLAAGDAGDIIPLNAASNAIEVTIPHTLFAAGGTGRAWECQHTVTSVAGGAITFVGSGGISVTYMGRTPIAAGDVLRVVVTSATTALVIITPQAASGTPAQVDYVRATGNWTKPAGAKTIVVRCVGAGGSGGGGPVATGAAGREGGGGGGGGAVAEATFDASLITSPVACTVPDGPAGGAGRIGGGGTGSSGTAAAATTFGTYLAAYAGGGGFLGRSTAGVLSGGGGGGTGGVGADGSIAATAGGAPGTSSATAVGGQGAQSPVTANGGLAEYGGGGGGGSSAAAVAFLGGGSIYGGGGGGCGGGVVAAGPAVAQPSAGGISGAYVAGTGGAAGTSAASPTAGADGADGDGMTKCGAGGGGGGSTVAANVNGANGGDGGDWGGGGGGGGCGEGSGNGGNGGAGGKGGIVVITYF